ncbi:hypothetical protein [Rhizobium indicum]|uniref:Uncharacterized protein n=1 Tax=Rhizobium indicum TaxID=2583231 RepID=A0ABX6PH93_9HYPH|nr:hypothetical protein [Rhizobium indicum]QKK17699.1 hypothetical protein FFM53_015190 [Rhizobium indicum]
MSFKIAAKRSATCGINAAPYGRGAMVFGADGGTTVQALTLVNPQLGLETASDLSADALDYGRAALSENTMRAYRSDRKDFRSDSGKRKNRTISLSCHAQSHRDAKFE